MKILLVDLLYIGDILFITPAIRVLQAAYPEAQIDVLTNRISLPVLQHNPLLHHVIVFDVVTKQGHAKRLLRQIAALRRERYDLAICLHGDNERASLLTGFSRAKRRCGYAKFGLHWLFERRSSPVLFNLYRAQDKHIAEEYLALLELIGVPCHGHRGLEMWADAESEQRAAQLWDAAGLNGNMRVVGMNSGASFPTKLWPISHFASLSDLLTAQGFTPVLFGSPDDVPRIEQIRAHSTTPALSLAGRTTLLQLLALLRRCALVVSGDSGPMHIAASQHVPVVALFGPTDDRIFFPFGTQHTVVRSDLSCLRCNKRQCDDHRCMAAISPEQVLAAALALLNV
ncbi:MAG TPA: lipopolysaccharide heptosyltransferase II [Armatimonadota bacterium]